METVPAPRRTTAPVVTPGTSQRRDVTDGARSRPTMAPTATRPPDTARSETTRAPTALPSIMVTTRPPTTPTPTRPATTAPAPTPTKVCHLRPRCLCELLDVVPGLP